MKRTSLPLRTARVHHAARRRGGGVAARGAGAAAERCRAIGFLRRAAVDPRCSDRRSVPAGTAAIWAMTEGHNVGSNTDGRRAIIDRVPAIAADLVARKSDVIVACGSTSALRAKQATTTIPIVFAIVLDPVGVRLCRELWRGRAAMSPALMISNPNLRQSGWNCLSEIAAKADAEPRPCRIRDHPERPMRSKISRRWRPRFGSS